MDLTPEQHVEACSIIIEVRGGAPLSPADREEFRAHVARKSAKKRKAMIQEAFSMAQFLPLDQCEKIDALLVLRGLPRMEVLLGNYEEELATMVAGVLQRKTIESEQERAAVVNELNDMTSDLTEEQRRLLEQLLEVFHQKYPQPLDE